MASNPLGSDTVFLPDDVKTRLATDELKEKFIARVRGMTATEFADFLGILGKDDRDTIFGEWPDLRYRWLLQTLDRQPVGFR